MIDTHIELFKIFDSLDKATDKVAIFTHCTPDPDAIGSALGMSWLLKTKYHLIITLP